MPSAAISSPHCSKACGPLTVHHRDDVPSATREASGAIGLREENLELLEFGAVGIVGGDWSDMEYWRERAD